MNAKQKSAPSEVESLEKKRFRDRKAQNAMRDRTRKQILDLEAQVAEYQKQERYLIGELEMLVRENIDLKQYITDSKLNRTRIREHMAIVSPYATSESSKTCGVTYASVPTIDIPRYASEIHDFQESSIPCNTMEYACQTDKMLQSHIAERRHMMDNQGRQSLPQPTNFHAVSLIQSKIWSTAFDTTSLLVSDILLRYKEIDTPPRRMAAFYIMYKMTNWLINQDIQTFNLLPTWLRPGSEQLKTAHPSWIDRVPWPNARTYLIEHPMLNYDTFASIYSSSFDISWTHPNEQITVSGSMTDGGRVIGGDQSLSPMFEQHLTRLKHWTVDEKFASHFPQLYEIIERDRMCELWQ